jgi:starch phosphorylase
MLKVSTVVELGELRPDEVDVELYYGSMKSVDSLTASQTKMMDVQEERGNGFYRYTCSVTCDTAGRFGFTARVTPRGDQRIKFIPGLLTWASN